MQNDKKRGEVMAPAGSFAAMAAAINAGCDSIFFGVEQLNMRARAANNFQISDLEEVAARAKEAGIKTYIALNTIMYDHDLILMKKIIDEAKRVGITAIIAADIAALQYGNEIGIDVHASTQLSISNFESVKFYSKFCNTMVLAREVDLKMIKKICQQIREEDIRGPSGEPIKIEIFVHGALCIAPSGRCQMSLIQTNTSAQRGACLQECRKKYRIIDEDSGREMRVENQYILSPKDLCTIHFLDQILDAGVEILKIEGRGRSPDYVDIVTRCYREAVDSINDGTYGPEKIDKWMKELATTYNRGFSDGYYMGRPLPEWSGYAGNRAKDERVFVGLVSHYFKKSQIAEIKLQANPLKVGDRLLIMGNTTGVVKTEIKEIMDEKDQLCDEVKNPATITVPVADVVRKNDKVYILKERDMNFENRVK